MKKCGCNPTPEQFEFPIIDDNINKYKFDFGTISNFKDLCQLKSKIICDFQDIVKSLECGTQPDLEILLQEISLIYINNERSTIFFK